MAYFPPSASTKNLGIKCLGILCTILISVVSIIIILPTYCIRVVVIYLANAFRSDFGDILSGKTALLAKEYFDKTPSRTNVVLTMIFEGSLTLQEVQALVLKNWIFAEGYDSFQQYPVQWLGFYFWKNISEPFKVDDYVHKFSGKEGHVTNEMLSEFVETQLNKKFAKHQSPWELHLVENYIPSQDEQDAFGKADAHSVLILNWHHALVDGTGVMTALTEGLLQQRWIRQQESPPPTKTRSQYILYLLTFPINSFLEIANLMSQLFVSSAFKVPDDKKEWHQVHARSGIFPIEQIKNIKNAFGVSYASVLMSAISAAVHSTGLHMNNPISIASPVPSKLVTKRKILDNQNTTISFDLSTKEFASPLERLEMANKLFERSRRSVIPVISEYGNNLNGIQFALFMRKLGENKMFPIALTNIAGVPENITLKEKTKWVHSRIIVGGCKGDMGVLISTLSHGKSTELHVTAERALMTREQAQQFVWRIKKEIDELSAVIPEKIQFYKK